MVSESELVRDFNQTTLRSFLALEIVSNALEDLGLHFRPASHPRVIPVDLESDNSLSLVVDALEDLAKGASANFSNDLKSVGYVVPLNNFKEMVFRIVC
jgi:hypothetical protein